MFDKSKIYLGVLCKKNHNHLESGKSLRYILYNNCCECSKINSKKQHDKECEIKGIKQRGSHDEVRSKKKQRKEQRLELIEKVTVEHPFNSDILFLDDVCDHDHKYNGFPFSLKYKSNSRCQECSIKWDLDRKFTRTRKPISKEKGREKSVKFRRENPDKIRAYNQKWYKEHWQNYYLENKNAILTKGRESNHSRRSLQKGHISAKNLMDYKAKFDHCVYCKKHTDNLTLDHVVPLSKGGSHSLDNIVFCCLSCNSSKNSSDLLTWSIKNMSMKHNHDNPLGDLLYRLKDIIKEYNLLYSIPW